MQLDIDNMDINNYIEEMTRNLYKPLMDILCDKHDICFDENNKLTAFGKTLVEGYNAMLTSVLKEWLETHKGD